MHGQGGMCGRRHVCRGACLAGAVCAGEMATEAGVMHSCSIFVLFKFDNKLEQFSNITIIIQGIHEKI